MTLSIIIPVYNVEKYIKKTLDSIFFQSFQLDDIEIIVVNDGTPDHSMDIVSQFASIHPNLKIINQENQGLSAARNTGIREAQGKYIWFVDSDDWIEEGFLPRVLALLKDCKDDVLLFKIREYDDNGIVLKEREFIDNDNIVQCNGKDVILNTARWGVLYTPMQMHVISTDFIKKNDFKFIEGIYHEDMEFAPRLLLKAKRVSYVPWVSYCYVKRTSQSITSDITKLSKRLCDLGYIANKHYNLMTEQKTTIAYQAMSFVVYKDIAYFHALCPQQVFQTFWKETGMNIIPYKKIVLKNLNHNHHLKLFFRQLIFLLSPYLLKKMRKSI